MIRLDCLYAMRPCGRISCKWHLFFDSPLRRRAWRARAELDPDVVADWVVDTLRAMPETCALDVSGDPEEHTLEYVGSLMDLTKERVRQIQVSAEESVQMAWVD